jgi:hypothetical protein
MINAISISKHSDFIAAVENTEGEKYLLVADNFNEFLADWFGNCEYVPSNESPVYFALFKGDLIDTTASPTFETLLGYISGRYGYSLTQS